MSTIALNALIAEAEDEARRVMTICNACRYCEGYCAVFPAMARRLTFSDADLHYLANLCHHCGACLHACQYAPPHEFAVNVPQSLAAVRVNTYTEFAWPKRFGLLYRQQGLALALSLALGLALMFLLAAWPGGKLWHAPLAGNFYAVFPHGLLVAVFGSVFGFALLAMLIGGVRFWRAQGSDAVQIGPAAKDAAHDIATLKHLGGGHGEGCASEDDRASLARRHFHQATMWGFALCFAATSVATLYHYVFGWKAPYALTSLPVILGTLGGIGLLVGPAGLWWLGKKRHPLHQAPSQQTMDAGLLALLFATSATGLALLALRDTSAMGLLLSIHLGVVMALFATMPYGKMVHGMYRGLALLKWHIERRKPLAHAAPE